MKATYNWLKDFVSITLSPEKLADKLTMAGLEVTSLSKFQDDYVFEIEVTPNRSDCLSILGIAREVAAITGKKMKRLPPSLTARKASVKGGITLAVKIENKQDCPFYSARVIKGIRVGRSPAWLTKRLASIGLRPVNNIVDITNYVLYETGQPLHAFDLDKLKGWPVIVRKAKRDEEITSIDGNKYTLNTDMLVIADSLKSVAIAGVIGGLDTEITEGTKNILLESAIFSSLVVRHARAAIGIGTDSSYRFERGVDAKGVLSASRRAAELIMKIASGRDAGYKSAGGIKDKQRSVIFNTGSLLTLLGVDIPGIKVKKILSSLGFALQPKAKNRLLVKVPSFRQDVTIEADLIEEIVRIYGYDNIPSALPEFSPSIDIEDFRRRALEQRLRGVLISQGLNEAISLSLLKNKLTEVFAYSRDGARFIINPLNAEQSLLRPTLFAGLLESAKVNFNQRQDKVLLFEQGRVFMNKEEKDALGILVSGEDTRCLTEGRRSDEYSAFYIKGILESVFSALGVRDYSCTDRPVAYLLEGSSFAVNAGKEELGIFGEFRLDILDRFGIKNKRVFAAEIAIEKLFHQASLFRQYSPLFLFPGIKRDISLILRQDISAGQLQEVVIKSAGPELRDVSVTDCYYGRQIPSGFKGIVLSCLYRADDHTLTDGEVNKFQEGVLAAITAELKAEIR